MAIMLSTIPRTRWTLAAPEAERSPATSTGDETAAKGPSRALSQSSNYDQFLGDAVERTRAVKQGHPLDTDTMIGAQASNDQFEKILSYIDIGRQEGAKVLAGGEEIFGPVVSVARFADYDDAMKIANDTLYGLGAGVWSRDVNTAYRAGRDIQAGRVCVNN